MTTTLTNSREHLSALTDRFVDAFNRQDIDAVMSFFAENAVYRDAYGKSHEADKEASMTGLDLLTFKNDKLVRKTTYRRG